METSTVVGFALTLGFLAVFLAVSVRQLARVRKVAAGEITVGPRPPTSDDGDPDDGPTAPDHSA